MTVQRMQDGTMPTTQTTRHRYDLSSPTKADATYEELLRRIVRGDLEAGSRIDQELIADEIGISVTPLREALRRLEADRLVERSAHREVVVAPLSRKEVRELYSVRIELDVLAIREAARKITPEELEIANRSLIDPPPSDPYEFSLGNRAFHHLLYQSTGNDVLVELLDRLWARTARYAVLLQPRVERAALGLREHRELIGMLGKRDEDAAEALMRTHLGSSPVELENMLS
jgi:DNA-binding GntR family transcriptional regulator